MDINKEQELQAQVESGTVPDSADARAYQKVYGALSRDPGFVLPATFIHQLMARVEARRLKEIARDRWLLISGWILFLIGFIVCLASVQFKPSVGLYTFLSSYAGFFVFAFMFVLAPHLLDRRLIRPKLKINSSIQRDKPFNVE